jgi:hypothetical protein
VRGPQQDVQVVAGECGPAEGQGVAAQQGQGVAGVEGDGGGQFGVGLAGEPGAFADQGQARLGQGRQVAGAHTAVLVDRGVHTEPKGLGQRRDERRVDAGAGGQELVRPDGHQRAGPAGREQGAGAAGVAAQQAQGVVDRVGRVDGDGAVGADARATAVPMTL